MKIRVNGQEFEAPSDCSLHELLQQLKIQTQAVAVAVNSEVIPRSELDKWAIQSNDDIEIIQPVGGG